MGGVDRTDQFRKSYGFDRKSRCSWIRLFFQFLDYAVNNAYLLYKHSCRRHRDKPKDLLQFRMELVHLLLEEEGQQRGISCGTNSAGGAQSARVCYLESVSVLNMKRGRCHQCQVTKTEHPHHTSFACGVCRARLCKTSCFAEFHKC